MKIKTKQSSIDTYHDYVYMENGLININRTILMFERLLKDDNIPFYEYISVINTIYKVEITDNDLIRISSVILGDNCKCAIIKTNLMYEVVLHNEITNYFEYNVEEYNLCLKVAFIDDEIIDYDHAYTPSEIKKMIEDKKIVLLDFVLDEENDYDFYEVYEYNGLCPLSNITQDNFVNLSDIYEDYVPCVADYLKSYFTIDRIKTDYKSYINTTRIKLDVIERYIKNMQKNKFTRTRKFNDILLDCEKIKRRKTNEEF